MRAFLPLNSVSEAEPTLRGRLELQTLLLLLLFNSLAKKKKIIRRDVPDVFVFSDQQA